MQRRKVLLGLLAMGAATPMTGFAAELTGKISGSAVVHTKESMARAIEAAWVALPAAVTGSLVYEGILSKAPRAQARAATVVFVHGSGGINPQIKAFQKWMAEELGIASVTLDSYQLPDRMTYSSPIAKSDYEKIHALRASELKATVAWLPEAGWFDGRFVIAGTSEGAVAVARYRRAASAPLERGRIIFSWSCEDNYHVESHNTHIPDNLPVLNVMSATDKFFSQSNSYLDNPEALGYAGKVLANNPNAEIVLLPGAPHTLMNLPQARDAVQAFINRVLRS